MDTGWTADIENYMPYRSKDKIFPFTSPCNLPHPLDLQHPLPHRLTQIISVERDYYCHSDSTTHIQCECDECHSTSCLLLLSVFF